ncbi:uncharacterized protein LOC120540185 [Polypterus senegalus]|uniref:uncharacterized protein LOC120540185 n=1 Tax=Polypterus senegalus TaxID=55291 RepID=UPI00196681D6|nr:uncharacterized protein LOC120540185 [Polypterus senegalus]
MSSPLQGTHPPLCLTVGTMQSSPGQVPAKHYGPHWNIPVPVWLFFRFAMWIYTFSWCIYGGIKGGSPKWLVYFTNLTYTLMSAYYMVAAVNLMAAVLYKYISTCCTVNRLGPDVPEVAWSSPPAPALPNCILISLRFQWLLHSVTSTSAVIVSLIYWTVIYSTEKWEVVDTSINMHLTNILQVLLELMLSSIPIHLLHVLYPFIYGVLYISFTVIYWAVGTANGQEGPAVYLVLNYGERPLLASGSAVGFLVVLIPLSHLFIWSVSLLREYLILKLSNWCKCRVMPTP